MGGYVWAGWQQFFDGLNSYPSEHFGGDQTQELPYLSIL
jgi:hypothetical protein